MPRLFFKYYWDTAFYNVLFCILFAVVLNVFECVVLFGTFGTFVSFLVYRHFQNIEYYFYRNGGLSKFNLQAKTGMVNLVVAFIIGCILWITSYR
jgi:hypothetical protein